MLSKILIFTGVIAVVQSTFICGPFEIFGLTCDDKCLGDGKSSGIGFGCTCILGFKRNNNGRCVPKNECCPEENEEHCETGSDKTCDDCDTADTIILPKKGRCCCKEGTVRGPNGKCIQKCDCPPKCTGQNEVYSNEGCDQLCDQKGMDSCECVKSSGCFCQEGYVRPYKNAPDCVPQNECECPQNECYMISGGCEKDCKGKSCLKCPGQPGCYCSHGYVRNEGECILQKHCNSCDTDENVDTDDNVE